MSDSEKKGLFSKIFGGGKSCCCNIRIEEVPEEEVQKKVEQGKMPCCGGSSPTLPDDDRNEK